MPLNEASVEFKHSREKPAQFQTSKTLPSSSRILTSGVSISPSSLSFICFKNNNKKCFSEGRASEVRCSHVCYKKQIAQRIRFYITTQNSSGVAVQTLRLLPSPPTRERLYWWVQVDRVAVFIEYSSLKTLWTLGLSCNSFHSPKCWSQARVPRNSSISSRDLGRRGGRKRGRGRWRVVGGLGLRGDLILRQRKGGGLGGRPRGACDWVWPSGLSVSPRLRGGRGRKVGGGRGCQASRPAHWRHEPLGARSPLRFLVEAPHLPSVWRQGPAEDRSERLTGGANREEVEGEGERDRKEANHQI